MSAAPSPGLRGVAELRRRRGDEQVKFRDVADHLVDFAERHPEAAPVVDDLAGFLAAVERLPHDHTADPDHGIPG